jgi:hypothetical protein
LSKWYSKLDINKAEIKKALGKREINVAELE